MLQKIGDVVINDDDGKFQVRVMMTTKMTKYYGIDRYLLFCRCNSFGKVVGFNDLSAMRDKLLVLVLFASLSSLAQDYSEQLLHYRDSVIHELYEEGVFLVDSSELSDHVQFYPADTGWIFHARLVRDTSLKTFKMATSTTRRPTYRIYGTVHFVVNQTPVALEVYQSIDLLKNPDYGDYLFCPFKDLSNSDSTYGGGRYLDIQMKNINAKGELTLDFNKCYNPYCAYNYKYSCPVPPKANHLSLPINAGVKRPSELH